MDHASGIPYIISQKALAHHNPARFFMPESMVTPMLEIMESWQKMEGHRYDFDFLPLRPGQNLELNTRYSFATFRSDHRVPTLGYILLEKRKKLRPEFESLSSQELQEAKRRGQSIEEHLEVPLLAFTGDTGIRVLDQVPELHKVRYLIIEVTYAGDKKGIEKAEKWGHIHLDQILPYLEKLECEKLIFSHWSMSHRTSDVQSLIKALPEQERKRIIAWL
jgi:ribonuclease Z